MAAKAKKTNKASRVVPRRKPASRAKGRGRAKPSTPARRKGGAGAGGRAIRIRMYRVGFGDCFLVSLPAEGKPAHILVDCGVHARGDLKTMPKVVEDIAAQTGKRLDLIIASHAHQDHVSGFSKCKDTFRQFSVGEVWLPWTEDPSDPLATKLYRARTQLTMQLAQHFNATGATGWAADAVLNATGNPDAMGLLRSGVNGGKVRYVKGGMKFDDAGAVKGLDIKVLSPPTDQKFLSVMNPPSGDRFLRLSPNGREEAANAISPFLSKWEDKQKKKNPPLSQSEMESLDTMLDQAEQLAFTLDSVLNNTSIVALMTFGGKNLLFPGDAQYGNWQSWMNSDDGAAILGNLHYYKIAHHGSHNATPKSALDKTPAKAFAAQISTQNTPWPTIPFKKMLDELDQKSSGYVRSDSIPLADVPKAPKGPPFKPQEGFTLGDFWCDYNLPL